jgi:tetratricopeptide (TPR) repeat protein
MEQKGTSLIVKPEIVPMGNRKVNREPARPEKQCSMKQGVFFLMLTCLLTFNGTESLAQNWTEIDSLVVRINKQIAEQEYERANANCDKLLKLYSGPEAHLLKARALIEGRRFFSADQEIYTTATFHLEEAIRLDSTYQLAYQELGALNLIYHQFDKAIVYFTKFIVYSTDSIDVFNGYTNRGMAKIFNKDIDGAIADYYLAKQIFPTHSSIYQNLGAILIDAERYTEAEELLLEGVRTYPGDDDLMNNLGFLYVKQEKYSEATACFDRVLEVNPGNYLALGNRGFCKLKLGDLKGAKKDMERSQGLYPENSYIYKNLGLLYLEKKDKKTACSMFMKANELGYSDIYDSEVNELLQVHCR